MRRLSVALVASFAITLASVLGLRTLDPAVALLALAATVAALATLVARIGPGSLGLLDPAWSLSLLLRGRVPVWDLLPTWAAHAVGAAGAGLLGSTLVDDLPVRSPSAEPDLLPALVVLATAAVLGAWLAAHADEQRAVPAVAGLPTIAAGVVLPAAFVAAVNPAALFGLGVAGVAGWTYVFFTALTIVAAAVLAGLTYRLLAPEHG